MLARSQASWLFVPAEAHAPWGCAPPTWGCAKGGEEPAPLPEADAVAMVTDMAANARCRGRTRLWWPDDCRLPAMRTERMASLSLWSLLS